MTRRFTPPPTLPGLEAFGQSPLRRQYLEQKRTHPNCILLFRLGDFYEMFDEDAEIAARTLNIVLTAREMGRGERVPMAGIPFHSADGYIARLIAAGLRVAVCEQTSEPNGRDLVNRAVVRVITPGTVEDAFLPSASNNFLLALLVESHAAGLAYVDVTTGELCATELRGPSWDAALRAELARLSPSECVLPEGSDYPSDDSFPLLTSRPAYLFGNARASQRVARQFGAASLHGLGLAEFPLAACALGALIEYVGETHEAALRGLSTPRFYSAGAQVLLDSAARRGLDLGQSSRQSGSNRGLHGVLDRTVTSMGARLLAAWVSQPLTDLNALQARQSAVHQLVEDPLLRSRLRGGLDGLADLERLAGRAAQRLSGPRDLAALARALRRVPGIRELLAGCVASAPLLVMTPLILDACLELVGQVEATLEDDPPAAVGEGVIKAGVSAELDELRALSGDARRWLAEFERSERERTGARGLKIGYNRVFGYYLEVSTATLAQPTDYYQRQQSGGATISEHLVALGYARKQTLSTAERFVTDDLKAHERRAEQARERSLALETSLFEALLDGVAADSARIVTTARTLAVIDCLASLAEVAATRGYVRPELDASTDLVIRGGRHPIVEVNLPGGAFVANDANFDLDHGRVMVLTGPNMAGKSTYGKSVLLLVLMAQIGSFVPAESARIGLVDRVFVRAGSAEDLAGGRSTFMVEMEETASFLHHATSRSLAFLDEVGRGTSTFDGMALARAILEFALNPPGPACRLIFSTHYHELAALEQQHPQARSYRMEVREDGERAVFLYRAVPGGADRSYGVHVARLAGIPEAVTRRAALLLTELESAPRPAGGRRDPPPKRTADPLRLELQALDLERMTPIEALTTLDRLRHLAQHE